jgi:hypothetical protein
MLVKDGLASQGESDRQRRLLKAIRQQQRVSGKTSNEKEISDCGPCKGGALGEMMDGKHLERGTYSGSRFAASPG